MNWALKEKLAEREIKKGMARREKSSRKGQRPEVQGKLGATAGDRALDAGERRDTG